MTSLCALLLCTHRCRCGLEPGSGQAGSCTGCKGRLSFWPTALDCNCAVLHFWPATMPLACLTLIYESSHCSMSRVGMKKSKGSFASNCLFDGAILILAFMKYFQLECMKQMHK
eukprot:1150667-Pelagomonas_calceolata.AAC.1